MAAMTALSQFTDGILVRQGDLNNVSANLDTLTQLTLGKPAASGVSSKPMVLIRLTSNLTVINTSDQLVNWQARDYDTDNLWVPSVPNRFTIQTPGKYVARAGATWVAGGGIRNTRIYVNGLSYANSIAVYQGNAASGVETIYTITSAPVALATGAAVYFTSYQNSGGPLDMEPGSGGTWASLEWVAPFS